MAQVAVYDMSGAKVSDLALNDAIFGLEPNVHIMHAALVNFLANQRQGTQSTKTRTEVSGGGKKPWRQKGTGNARQGSTRSPQWRHGGVALGPKPRSYTYAINKKERRLALMSALSDKVANSNLIVLNNLEVGEFKTKKLIGILKALKSEGKTLIILDKVDIQTIKSAGNISGVKTVQTNEINIFDLLHHDKIIVVEEAVKKIEEVYA